MLSWTHPCRAGGASVTTCKHRHPLKCQLCCLLLHESACIRCPCCRADACLPYSPGQPRTWCLLHVSCQCCGHAATIAVSAQLACSDHIKTQLVRTCTVLCMMRLHCMLFCSAQFHACSAASCKPGASNLLVYGCTCTRNTHSPA